VCVCVKASASERWLSGKVISITILFIFFIFISCQVAEVGRVGHAVRVSYDTEHRTEGESRVRESQKRVGECQKRVCACQKRPKHAEKRDLEYAKKKKKKTVEATPEKKNCGIAGVINMPKET
jgi:hypothetical protein